jgi:CelD/BcsL family acetyltransferase involved in cellulose biosynthesis
LGRATFDVSELESGEEQTWNAVVDGSDWGTFFHTSWWKNTLQTALGLKAVYLKAEIGDGIVGIWPNFVDRSGRWNRLSMPHSDYGGPCVVDGNVEVIDALYDGLLRLRGPLKVASISFLMAAEAPHHQRIRKLGFSPVETLCSFRLDLEHGPSALWSKVTGTERTAVRKAEKQGIFVREASAASDLEDYYALHLVTSSRAQFTAFPRSLFSEILRYLVPNGKAKILLAEKSGRIIAGTIVMLHKGIAHAWNLSSDPQALKSAANELLIWNAVKLTCELGMKKFDFGTTPTDPRSGIHLFKRRFNGRQLSISRERSIISPFLRLSYRAYSTRLGLKWVKSRLYDSVRRSLTT